MARIVAPNRTDVLIRRCRTLRAARRPPRRTSAWSPLACRRARGTTSNASTSSSLALAAEQQVLAPGPRSGVAGAAPRGLSPGRRALPRADQPRRAAPRLRESGATDDSRSGRAVHRPPRGAPQYGRCAAAAGGRSAPASSPWLPARLREPDAGGTRTLHWLYGLVVDLSRSRWTLADAHRSNEESVPGRCLEHRPVPQQPSSPRPGAEHRLWPVSHARLRAILPHASITSPVRARPVPAAARGLRSSLLQVTTTSLAHSMTLGLSLYGVVSLSRGWSSR